MNRIWRFSLAAFVLAGFTGALFRYMSVAGAVAGLSLVNIRHAHTHLMYFAWATPAVFSLIAFHIARSFDREVPRLAKRSMVACLILGLTAYGSFLLFGYQPVQMGSVRIPPSVIVAGLNMIA